MSKELVISANQHETKLGILEDDQLVEVFFQRANEYSLAGSIHKGRVTRVLPGMQSAFVDLGLERDTFLYVSDFFEENEEFDRLSVTREEGKSAAPELVETEVSAAPELELDGNVQPSVGSRAAAGQERGEGEGRERHGRRSRRRRNRGRGFPDSKYATAESRSPRSGDTAPAPEAAASTTAPKEPAPQARDSEFSVLPGESLAKYTRSAIPPLDEAEEEEIRSLQEPDEPAIEAAEAEESAPEETPDPIAEAANEPSSASAGRGAATATAMAVAEEAESGAEKIAAIADPDEETIATEEPAPDIETSIEAEIETEIEAAIEAEVAEDQAIDEIDPAVAQEPVPETEAPAAQLTAQVREQGGRYMHRLPRRMRRKMRGGGGQESRFTEASASAVPEMRAEQSRAEQTRTVSRPDKTPQPSITELLKEGQEIIVQIAKEPLGQKGARITSHIALPGRYVVYMPTVDHTGVSRKIASDEERQRLKRILQTHQAGVPGGFIVRTAGEGKTEDEIAADMNFLFNLWLDIRQKAEKRPAPVLLHHDLDIVQRTLRDQFNEQFKAVWVDNEELYESVLRFVQRFHPSLVARVKLYTRPEPIFDAFNITAELEKALRPKVWLKSGGYIVINQTEALVAIDVNTGKYVGRSNRLEDTIVKTNTEAVKEIVRQVRLRDLGGIIVVDFIDMDERKNRQKVMQVLEEAMRADRAPNKILQFNDFGLVAITRKRVKQSLERALCTPCPYCEGAGYVKSVQTIITDILQEAHKIAAALEGKDVMLRVNPDVAKVLKSNHNKYLEELEEILRRPVLVKGDPALHHEKFDLA